MKPLRGSKLAVKKEPSVGIESLKDGDGVTHPKKGDDVTVHYTGTLRSNGKQFDSSRDNNSPFTFTYGQGEVIEGWDKTLEKLTLGQRAKITIPSELAYGSDRQDGIP